MTETLQAREDNEHVQKRIDQLVGDDGNRSELLREAVHDYINSPQIWDDKIQAAEQDRDRLLEEKQRVERELERTRDRITDLKDRRSEARTLQKIERQLPASRIEDVARIARQNKYDNDPRTSTVEEVIEKWAERIADQHGFEVELVKKVLRIRVNV